MVFFGTRLGKIVNWQNFFGMWKSDFKPKISVDLQKAKNIKLIRYNVSPSQIFRWQCVTEYQNIVNKDEKESDNEK